MIQNIEHSYANRMQVSVQFEFLWQRLRRHRATPPFSFHRRISIIPFKKEASKIKQNLNESVAKRWLNDYEPRDSPANSATQQQNDNKKNRVGCGGVPSRLMFFWGELDLTANPKGYQGMHVTRILGYGVFISNGSRCREIRLLHFAFIPAGSAVPEMRRIYSPSRDLTGVGCVKKKKERQKSQQQRE